MGGKDFQAGEAVEGSFEDQVLQGNRGIERIADGIRQPTVALEALGEFRRALWMDEQNGAEFFGFGPHRMEFGVGKVLPQHTTANGGATQALLLDRGFELLHCKVGKLQRQRGESPKSFRPRRTEFGQFFVLNLDDLAADVAVLTVPEWIDREYLHIDRHRVHLLETLLDDDEVLGNALDRGQHLAGRIAHQVDGFMKIAVRVRIDGPDPLAVDLYRQARSPWLCVGRIQHAATAECDPRRGRALQKMSTAGHSFSPPTAWPTLPLTG